MMRFFKNKRGYEINSQFVIYLLTTILIIALLIFAFKSFGLIDEKRREASMNEVVSKLANAIEILSSKYGSLRLLQIFIPDDIDTVCFLDLNHRNTLLENTTLVNDYPLINDSLVSGSNENMFLIIDSKVVDARHIGNLCFEYNPFYLCLDAPTESLNLLLEGLGECVTLSINWSRFMNNHKNNSFYDDSTFFMIQEKRDGDEIINWREILTIVPLTLFREGDEINLYDYSVVYKPDNEKLNIDDVKELMDVYDANKTYFFDSSYSGGSEEGYTVEIRSTEKEDYLKLWDNFSNVVLIDYDNTASSMIAALLAAYINSPLIFINDENLDDYKDIIHGKQALIVTHGNIKLDKITST